MDNYKINKWGTFTLQETENEFLDRERVHFSNYIKFTILFSGIGYLLVCFADYFGHGFGTVFYISSAARFTFFLICLIMFFFISKRIKFQYTILLMFINALLNLTLLVFVILVLNPDRQIDAIDEITLPVILLMVLVLAQIPLKFLIILAVYGISLYSTLLIFRFQVSTNYLINFYVLILSIALLGLILGKFLNISRRKDFSHTKEVELLHNALLLEIEERNNTQVELEKVLTELKDSLNYAQSLQLTLIPHQSELKKEFPDSFVLFKPRAVVSGDFYWVKTFGSKTIIVVADCTGHGIPGAFMSIFGLTLLNMIVKKFNDNSMKASDILTELETEVISTMKSSDEARERKDGMDISLCIIDKEKQKLQFSGAYSDLWIVRDKKDLQRIKGVKKPIGIHFNNYDFVDHNFDFFPGDSIYLFTDGYRDQFGGTFGKRFMSKNLEKFILYIQEKNMAEQRKALLNEFNNWKKDLGQVDDMLMLGLRF